MEVEIRMSSSGSGIREETAIPDHQDDLPAYLICLSLGFKLVVSLITVLMAGWVFATIKTTKSLHKPHNVFVATLMITDILMALFGMLASGSLTVAYLFGVEDLVSCNVFWLPSLPACMTGSLYVVISVDKVIAVKFPLRYKAIMTPRAVRSVIIVSCALAILRCVGLVFFDNNRILVAEYGVCVSVGAAFVANVLIYFLPAMLASVLTLILNVYLAIKAYQIQKEIQKETSLSGGGSSQVRSLKRKLGNLRKQMKPVITLLVVMVGSVFIGMFLPLLYIPTKVLIDATLYHKIVDYIILPNLFFMPPLLHPFVYGLYFRFVREPMMTFLKRIHVTCRCKLNSAVVAPLPRKTAYM